MAKIKFQTRIQTKERIVVGRNAFHSEEYELPGGVFELPPDVEEERVAFVKEFRERRNKQRAKQSLEKLGEKVGTQENLIPYIIEALKSDVTFGEITDTLTQAVGFKIKV